MQTFLGDFLIFAHSVLVDFPAAMIAENHWENDIAEKFITDRQTGLRYEPTEACCLIAGENRPIGVWKRWHLLYIRRHKIGLYV